MIRCYVAISKKLNLYLSIKHHIIAHSLQFHLVVEHGSFEQRAWAHLKGHTLALQQSSQNHLVRLVLVCDSCLIKLLVKSIS